MTKIGEQKLVTSNFKVQSMRFPKLLMKEEMIFSVV